MKYGATNKMIEAFGERVLNGLNPYHYSLKIDGLNSKMVIVSDVFKDMTNNERMMYVSGRYDTQGVMSEFPLVMMILSVDEFSHAYKQPTFIGF